MPNDKRARSVSQERHSCASPFSYRSSNCHKHSSPSSSQNPVQAAPASADVKEWEEARCPICMEHPHNAVLLLCTSNDKGCRAYMCDTSYRHSNCLDQFRKRFPGQTSSQEKTDEHIENKLYCPLCRGTVMGWTVVDAARHFMNAKSRSCSLESCEYNGSYEDLRKHARVDHPYLRPAQADPERLRDWRRMEQQRDLSDLLSSMRSSLGMEEGELEVGDIVVDDDSEGNLLPATSIARVTLYVFIQFLGTGPNMLRYFSRTTPRTTAGGSRRARRARLWGEAYNDDIAGSVSGERSGGVPATDEFVLAPPELRRPRSRRRRMRLPDEDDDL